MNRKGEIEMRGRNLEIRKTEDEGGGIQAKTEDRDEESRGWKIKLGERN